MIKENRLSVISKPHKDSIKTGWSLDNRCKVNYDTIKSRMVRGWDAERALTEPSRKVSNESR